MVTAKKRSKSTDEGMAIHEQPVQPQISSLSRDQLEDAVMAVVEHQRITDRWGGEAMDYLNKTSVSTFYGTPYCHGCKKSFSKDVGYAKHMMSIAHFIVAHKTTPKAVEIARSWIISKNALAKLCRDEISIEDFLDTSGLPQE